MKYFIQLLSLVILLTVSSSTMADLICTDLENPNDDVLITQFQLALEDESGTVFNVSQGATDCIGLLSGNDSPEPTGSNIGEYMDGLLNGKPQSGGTHADDRLKNVDGDNTLFDPFYTGGNEEGGSETYNDNLAFISAPDDLQNLTPGDEVVDDPGWVFLGKDDGNGEFEYARTGIDIVDDIPPEGEESDGLKEGIDIGKLISVDFTCYDDIENIIGEGFSLGDADTSCTEGIWSIMPVWNIVDLLGDLFGKGFFDHLAFVFKSGNVAGDGGSDFAIYDFNFNDIFAANPDALTVPHNFWGTFDLGDTFDNHGISHVSMHVRDPLSGTPTEISEPSASLLLLLGLIIMLVRFKSNHGIL